MKVSFFLESLFRLQSLLLGKSLEDAQGIFEKLIWVMIDHVFTLLDLKRVGFVIIPKTFFYPVPNSALLSFA
jgi:hypothetical protein